VGLNVEGFHRILPLALIGLLVWQLLLFVWSFLPMASEKVLAPLPMNTEKSAISAEINMASVVALDLFGHIKITNEKPKVKPKAVISAPDTALNLKLKGIYKSDGDTPSSVIIEGSDKKQSVYFVGELLQEPSRIKVHEIHPRHVILERGERYEKLALFGDLKKQKMVSEAAVEQGFPEDEIVIEEDAIPTIDQTQNEELTKKMTGIINVLQNDPLSLKGAMVIQPVEEGDALKGYKVSPGDDSALFTEMGFIKGDVITAINDIELTSPGKIMSVIGGLSSATEIEIRTLRDEQPLAFHYRVE
jgi:general secretion pathway protein C